MKNITVYSGCSHKFFKDVVKSKRKSPNDLTRKERFIKLIPKVKPLFESFDKKFDKNTLVLIDSSKYKTTNKTKDKAKNKPKDDLLNLYEYKSKVLQNLKIELTTDSQNRVHNTCQNCTISEVNSFDHYIPKDDYPEFSVHPKNLIPSCTKCNSKKSTTWKVNNKVVFLNLYLDTLPSLQYLFVDFRINGDDIDFEYFIDNRNNINKGLFELIRTHYEKLNLLQRFRENSDLIISEIDYQFRKRSPLSKIEDIAKEVIDTNEGGREIYGFNYWKSILAISLVSNLDYLKSVEKKYFK